MPKAPRTTSVTSAPTAGPSKLSKAAKAQTSAKSTSLKPMTYSSFLPIPLSIPTPLPIPSSSTSRSVNAATHYLYARAHTKNASAGAGDAQAQTLPTDRTVFVANIPVDMTEHTLRSVFGRWGVVERIQYSGGRGGDGLEMAVLGIEPDSDDEENEDDDAEEQAGAEGAGEGDAAEGGNGESGGGVDGVAAGAKFIGDATLPRRQRKRLNKLPSSVPIITPLPSLDPRSAANPNSLGDAYHPSGARCAHIVYLDSSPLASLLHPNSPHSVIPIKPDASVPTGLPYYLALHSALRPSLAAVRAFADTSMARFDHLSSLLLSSRARAQGAGALVDEDGFTVVVRSGKGGRTGGLGDGTRKGTTSVGVASRGFGKRVKGGEVGLKKGKGAQELPDFYKFQKMERKRQELADLRNQFEKDKAKVAAMRHAKRFKPY